MNDIIVDTECDIVMRMQKKARFIAAKASESMMNSLSLQQCTMHTIADACFQIASIL